MANINRRNIREVVVAGAATPYLITTKANAEADAITSWQRDSVSSEIDVSRLNRHSEQVFDISVASGEPTPTGITIWTHIRPNVYVDGEMLIFQVAADKQFNQLVLEGEVAPQNFGPDRDHTVKIDLDGELSPDRYFYYRFIYSETVSRIGQCKTTPVPGPGLESLNLGILTCQDYTNSY